MLDLRSSMLIWLCGLLLLWPVALSAAAPRPAPGRTAPTPPGLFGPAGAKPQPDEPLVILDANSFWRCHITLMPLTVRSLSGELEVRWKRPIRLGRGDGSAGAATQADAFVSPPPPPDWTQPEFDDSAWPRLRGPVLMEKRYPHGEPKHFHQFGLLCFRGKFAVSDPAGAANLALSLSYRGGAVVYVNGRELLRDHMPAGQLAPDTPAEDYPRQAYLNEAGGILDAGRGKGSESEQQAAAMRVRSVGPVKVPASMLRRGVNLLAIELHRAPTAECYLTKLVARDTGTWSQLALVDAKLTAPATAKTVSPNSRRPKGVGLFVANPLIDVHDLDYADPNEPVGARSPIPVGRDAKLSLALAGARNAACSGELVLGSDQPIERLKVAVSELRQAGGPGAESPDAANPAAGFVIPPTAVQVRYGLADGTPEPGARVHYPRPSGYSQFVLRRFDGLEEFAPERVAPTVADPRSSGPDLGATQPIWITVNVPANAAAGIYQGTVRIEFQSLGTAVPGLSSPVSVPLRLEVADFVLPDPKQFVSFVGLVQSPDTLATRYNVPLWSARHWELIERSMRLLGQVGNDCLLIPLVCNSHYGNTEGMVRWIKPAPGNPDAGFGYDLSIAEKYVDLAIKHWGRLPIVCFGLWEPVDAYSDPGLDGRGLPLLVSVVDPASGKVETMRVPDWGTPASRAFWKPVLEKISGMLAGKGLADSMCIGNAAQAQPGKVVCDDLEAVLPGFKWYAVAHPYVDKVRGTQTAISIHVYGLPGSADVLPAKRFYGWQFAHLNPYFPRGGAGFLQVNDDTCTAMYRMCLEGLLTRGARGIGHVGADFWRVVGQAGRQARLVRPNWSQLSLAGRAFGQILAPGRDGPVATARFEMFREGVQETETRIFIEKALTDPASKAKLGTELADRAQRELDDRARAFDHASTTEEGWFWFAQTAPEQARRLYAIAAQVAARLR